MRFIERWIFNKIAPNQIKYLTPLDYAAARGLSASVLEQLEEDFVVGPPLTLHMPNPALFAAVWSMGRECLVVGREGRAMREAVAATVSGLNVCPYCVDIHTSMLHSVNRSDIATALQDDHEVREPRVRDAVTWASATLNPQSPLLESPPFTAAEAPQMLGTAVCFHYVNRMVNVFLESSPFPIRHGEFRRTMRYLFGGVLNGRISAQDPAAGRFLTGISPAQALPHEFSWATSSPSVAGSLARMAVAAEQAGEETIDIEVRHLVEEHVGHWNGQAPGLDRRWIKDAVEGLADSVKPAARLALLTALASYQVGDGDISSFRQQHPSDRALVNITAWASYVAMKRIASWFKAPRSQ